MVIKESKLIGRLESEVTRLKYGLNPLGGLKKKTNKIYYYAKRYK